MTKLAIPTIHLNGTGRDNLEREYAEALDAVSHAQQVVAKITVHGRDYYPQRDNHAFNQAQEQHLRHLRDLQEIHDDLTNILIGIQKQDMKSGITLDEYNRRWDMIMAAVHSGTHLPRESQRRHRGTDRAAHLEVIVMSFTNQFFLGVTQDGYTFLNPPRQTLIYTDEEMLALAALIVAMKPALRARFDEVLAQVESGE